MDTTQQAAALTLPALLLANLISAIGSAATFVLILGLFQYYSYRKWWKKLIAVRDILIKQYGAENIARAEQMIDQQHGTKN